MLLPSGSRTYAAKYVALYSGQTRGWCSGSAPSATATSKNARTATRLGAADRRWLERALITAAVINALIAMAEMSLDLSALGLARFQLKYSAGPLPHARLTSCIELYATKVVPLVRDMLA